LRLAVVKHDSLDPLGAHDRPQSAAARQADLASACSLDGQCRCGQAHFSRRPDAHQTSVISKALAQFTKRLTDCEPPQIGHIQKTAFFLADEKNSRRGVSRDILENDRLDSKAGHFSSGFSADAALFNSTGQWAFATDGKAPAVASMVSPSNPSARISLL
jgi:hypothetical protein